MLENKDEQVRRKEFIDNPHGFTFNYRVPKKLSLFCLPMIF